MDYFGMAPVDVQLPVEPDVAVPLLLERAGPGHTHRPRRRPSRDAARATC